jgi:hypothetical protein
LLPTFHPGATQISASQLNEIVRQVLISLNITTSAPLQVTKSVAGCHLSLGTVPTWYGHGKLGADLTPSTSPQDCTMWNYDGSAEATTGTTIKVRCIDPLAWMKSGTWVRVSIDSGVYYAWPLSCKWHGALSGDLVSGATASCQIWSAGSGTGVSVTVSGLLLPDSSTLPSGTVISFYLDCDGTYYADAANACPSGG